MLKMQDYSNLPDSDLSSAIKQSDEFAFEAFYHRYYKSLFRFIWSRTRSTELAREIVQETFIRLWQNRQKLDCMKSIKAYIYRIVYNLLMNHLRRNKIHRAYINAHQNHVSTENIELQADIYIALRKLPEKIRLVFILNHLEGFKYAEIAETCGISIKTVESRMSKALRILRKEL
jgi:RNA polymerase sigma-70 factor (ECF subfamily)